ncbi:hypothetical protein FG386_002576 [Cryptosporidium ryanae]|uniref:uncharacterized protein n=1 Tax=Cryptosporidium ryanae TaxID=515981 RepID=UPI00351A3622|nr:hypothetical protein FG386_002576 [Cryptosporidium ryanae]
MLAFVSFISIISYLFLGYLWKYLEEEYGIFTSSLSITFIIFTLYGLYVYVKNSLYIELNIGNLLIKKENKRNNSEKILSVSKRYSEEKQKNLNKNFQFVDDNITKTLNHVGLEVNTPIQKLKTENRGGYFPEKNISFFGLSMTSPSRKPFSSFNDTHNVFSSGVPYSKSSLVNSFIKAASAAHNFMEYTDLRGDLSFNTPQQCKNEPITTVYKTPNSYRFSVESKSQIKLPIINSIKSSLNSNLITTAKSKFGDYISSIQGRISTEKVRRNSVPGEFIKKSNFSDTINYKGTTLTSALDIERKKNNWIKVEDEPEKLIKTNRTPVHKINLGLSSPLPTGKTSPLLLLTEKKL